MFEVCNLFMFDDACFYFPANKTFWKEKKLFKDNSVSHLSAFADNSVMSLQTLHFLQTSTFWFEF